MSRKKRKSQGGIPRPRIRGTHHLTQVGVEVDEIRSLILRRRLQLLVHSYIYYDLNNNLMFLYYFRCSPLFDVIQ